MHVAQNRPGLGQRTRFRPQPAGTFLAAGMPRGVIKGTIVALYNEVALCPGIEQSDGAVRT
jgi:hypothetical protein